MNRPLVKGTTTMVWFITTPGLLVVLIIKLDTFLICVDNSNAFTLHKILLPFVHSGTIIKADCWQSYNLDGLPSEHHDRFNHKENFVNPQDPQTIKILSHTCQLLNMTCADDWVILTPKGMKTPR